MCVRFRTRWYLPRYAGSGVQVVPRDLLREENRLKTVFSEPANEPLCVGPVEDTFDPYPVRWSCRGINHHRRIAVRTQLMNKILGVFADVKRAGLNVVAEGLLGARGGDPERG